MSQPISKSSNDSLILGLSVTVLAVLVFVLSYRVSSYVSLQNDNLNASIQNMKRQLEQSKPMIEAYGNFRNALLQYVQKTGDGAVLQRMAYYGIVQVKQQEGQPAAPGAAQPATSAAPTSSSAPAAPPASSTTR